MDKELLRDRALGSLVGGAVGDALGYPVEFIFSFKDIAEKYGERGITEFDVSYPWLDEEGVKGKALVSDDTQMTLYTAEGIINARDTGAPLLPAICDAYIAWYGPQVGRKVNVPYNSKLALIEDLNQRRAPGNTCLTALTDVYNGRVPRNDSKGCGGIMRVAPIGIYGALHKWSVEETGVVAGEAAELTHKHKMSTFASALQAMIIQTCLITEGRISEEVFKGIVENSLERLPEMYPGNQKMFDEFSRLIRESMDMAECDIDDWEVIETRLGGGWVAEETLTISIFSVLRHINDFKGCMICAVNHGGDSDSTGAVAGNIIGAIVGYEGIPEDYKQSLQFHDLIVEMTDELIK